MKHIITSIFVNDKNKEGQLLKTKDGKPFKKIAIKVAKDEVNPQEYDNQYLSCLVFRDDEVCLGWQAGDEIDILIDKNGSYFNFKVPSRLDRLETRIKALENFLLDTNKEEVEEVRTKESYNKNIGEDEMAQEEEDLDEEIPF